MDGLKLKEDILSMKARLNKVESDLHCQIRELVQKEEMLTKVDAQADELMQNESQIITFNICGKKFMTRLSTLLKTRDTLFYKIILSKEFNPKEELFFDRDPKYFEIILDFLRTKKINLKRFNVSERNKLRKEISFFEIGELIELIGEKSLEVEFESFEFSGPYISGGQIVGTNQINDITDSSMLKGICAISPGWITITLNRECEIDGIDIEGFRGNTTYWSCENGAYSSIKTSTDKSNWVSVGIIPSGYGTSIKSVKFSRTKVKYLKFDYTSYVGIGYLKLHIC